MNWVLAGCYQLKNLGITIYGSIGKTGIYCRALVLFNQAHCIKWLNDTVNVLQRRLKICTL
jgi:hypothetical protein